MLMTALKPMGSTTAQLAAMAYDFAKGGIDVVKDDHGLADQPYSRFDERVRACAAAVARANAETGRRCIYAPCICAPAHLVGRGAGKRGGLPCGRARGGGARPGGDWVCRALHTPLRPSCLFPSHRAYNCLRKAHSIVLVIFPRLHYNTSLFPSPTSLPRMYLPHRRCTKCTHRALRLLLVEPQTL